MKKYLPLLTLAILLFVLGYLTIWNKGVSIDKENIKEIDNDFPVSIQSKNVGNVSLHYFFTGVLKELKKVSDGTEIIYIDSDPSLPKFIVTDKTRVSKITPPYELNNTRISIDSLKPGQTIDISAEYDLRSKTWNLQDVFIATDRN